MVMLSRDGGRVGVLGMQRTGERSEARQGTRGSSGGRVGIGRAHGPGR